MPATLFVVATPIGNLDDMTARALRVLREVALIAAEDTRRTARLLSRYAIPTPTTSFHEHNEWKKAQELVERLKNGDSIALVSDAGAPTVSDPGVRLVRAAIDAGVRVEPIPGPSAAMAALTVSGMPADRFTFLGFPPTRSKDRKNWLERVRCLDGTLVFFEAPHRIVNTLQDVLDSVGDCDALVARELTKAHEELVRGPISTVLTRIANPIGEFTVVLNLATRPIMEAIEPVGEDTIAGEFGLMTISGKFTRRAAVSALARKYGRPAREVYSAIERAKSKAD